MTDAKRLTSTSRTVTPPIFAGDFVEPGEKVEEVKAGGDGRRGQGRVGRKIGDGER